MRISLRDIEDPWNPDKPHIAQQKILSLRSQIKGETLTMAHMIAGRGSGKSIGILLLVLEMCLNEKGLVVLVLSPTVRKLEDNLLAVWFQCIPQELYTYKASERAITLINGSRIIFRSRMIKDIRSGRLCANGLSVSCVIDDEAAEGYDSHTFNNVMMSIRKPSKHRCYITATTPVLNEYYQKVSSPGHIVIHATSADNPHLPADFVENARREMSPLQFQREIMGEWTDLGGRIWESFSFDKWPKGNIFEFTHDRARPFIVSCDIGSANSSYLIWQNVETDTKRLWVVTAEYHPTKSEDGSVRRMFEKVYNEYGVPMKVVAGNDMATRVATDNKTPFYFVRKIFGSIPTITPIEIQRDKQVQYDVSTGLIKTGTGERRLVVASGLQSYDPDNRGILKTMELDAFSEDSKKGEFFPKGAHVKWEHARDAMLYFVVCQGNIPRMIKTNYLGNKAA